MVVLSESAFLVLFFDGVICCGFGAFLYLCQTKENKRTNKDRELLRIGKSRSEF